MPVLYLNEHGTLVRKESERLVLERNRKKIGEIPLFKIHQVVVQGRVQFTSAALQELLQRGIEVSFLNGRGDFMGRLQGAEGKNNLLRLAQYQVMQDGQKCCYLASRFIWGKLRNMAALLQRGQREGAMVSVRDVERLHRLAEEVLQTKDLERLRGLEGMGAALYFANFGQLIKAEFTSFPGRVKHPPRDPVNSMLSYLYTVLAGDATSLLQTAGLDPYLGFLHQERYGRLSLSYDMIEEFRPLMVDPVVLSAINKRMVKVGDFEQTNEGTVLIKPAAKKVLVSLYEKKKQSLLVHPMLGHRVTYQQVMEIQVRLLAKYLRGEGDYLPFVRVK